MHDAATQYSLRAADVLQAGEQTVTQFRDVVRPTVGERVFGRMPGRFDRVQFWRIGRQLLQMQPGVSAEEVFQPFGMVNRCSVSDHDDVPA